MGKHPVWRGANGAFPSSASELISELPGGHRLRVWSEGRNKWHYELIFANQTVATLQRVAKTKTEAMLNAEITYLHFQIEVLKNELVQLSVRATKHHPV